MKKSLLILTVVSFALAVGLILLDMTKYVYHLNGTRIQIYPAAFLSLMGVWLLFRALMRKRNS